MPFDFTTDTRPKIKLTQLIVLPNRVRKDFSHCMDLCASIKEHGLAQPIVVTLTTDADVAQHKVLKTNKEGESTYILHAGESRYRCYLLIPEAKGLIPFTLLWELSPIAQREIELEENLRRKNLEWTEQCEALKEIDDLKREIYGDATPSSNGAGWALKETAKLVGVDTSTVSKQIKLAKEFAARPDIKERVKNMPMTTAIRVVQQIKESERVGRLHANGELQLTHSLVNDNAVDFLKRQKSDSIDLILTDPPFGMNTVETNAATAGPTSSTSYTSVMKAADNLSSDAALTLLAQVLPECCRVLKPGAHFYLFLELELLGETKKLLTDAGLSVSWPVIIWDKMRGTTVFKGYSYVSCYEAVLFGFKPPTARRLNSPAQALLKFSQVHATKKIHIFEKPADLLAVFIKNSTNVGDIVCDPFAGSGSTLLTARQLGRTAVGCELDKEHFFLAQERLLRELKK